MIKTYINNNPFNLSTSVMDKNNKSYLIDFTGYSSGRGREANRSEFTTDSEELQEAIESDPRYGKIFTCTSPLEVEKPSEEVPLEVAATATNTSPVTQDDNQSTEVAGVTNAQMAIEWLAINKEHKFATRPSKAEVLSVATLLGVVFTEWK